MTRRELHLSVLIAGGDDDAELLKRELRNGGVSLNARNVDTRKGFAAALSEEEPDIILADYSLPRFGAKSALKFLAQRGLNIPVIVIADDAPGDREARECLKLGAADYLPKKSLARLNPAAVRAYFERKLCTGNAGEPLPAEDELRGSQSRFEAVWRHSRDGMRLTNREGVVQAVNDSFCRLVGLTEKELVNQSFTVVYPEDRDHEALRFNHVRRFDEGIPLIQEARRTRFLNGTREVDVEVTILRISAESGEELLLTLIRDISERIEREAKFLRSQRMECVGAFAGGIAHDFNNILASIFMASSMLGMQLSPADRKKALSTIEESGQRGAEIVRRLLLFARGVEGEKKTLQPALLFHELAATVYRSFPGNIELEAKIPADLWNVIGDGAQLHQVLMNLCDNARDAMPGGGKLLLEARNTVIDSGAAVPGHQARSGSYVSVTIADNGKGISSEYLDRIFDPFFSTKDADAGTGLGLSTSLGIIKSHGGFITVESELGKGARFNLYLPVWDGAEAPGTDESRTAGQSEVILVVDDELLVREVMSNVLRKSGFDILVAASGAEALAHLESNKTTIKAIVTDLIMPRMDGLQLLRKVRETHPDLPAIAMSGNVAHNFSNGLAALGVTEIIVKPFRADQLLKAIRSAIGEASAST